jgi:hypothetical protein
MTQGAGEKISTLIHQLESPLGLQADYPGALSPKQIRPSSLPPRLVTLEAQPEPNPQGNELVTSAHDRAPQHIAMPASAGNANLRPGQLLMLNSTSPD